MTRTEMRISPMAASAWVYGLHLRWPLWVFAVALFVAWLVSLGAFLLDSPIYYEASGFLIALAIGASAFLASMMIVLRFRPSVLTPISLMFLVLAVYFGVGPWYHITDAGDLPMYTRNYPLGELQFFRAQFLNLFGLTFLLLGLLVARWLFFRGARRSLLTRGDVGLRQLTSNLLSLMHGTSGSDKTLTRTFRYSVVLAFVFRMSDHFMGVDLVAALPGFLNVMDKLGWVAVLVGAVQAGRKGGVWWLLLLLPLGLEMVEGALRLRKSLVLYPAVLALVGIYIGGRSMLWLLSGGALVLLALYLLKPVIDTARSEIWVEDGSTPGQFAAQFLDGGVDLDTTNTTWARLNYTPVQAGLMAEYDRGVPGNTFAEMYWVFIPRFLAPDSKPILDFGRRTTLILFGHERSSTGPTVFGEAYWNGGWPLVAKASFATGGLLYIASLLTFWLLTKASMFVWPLVLMAFQLGQLLSNFFTQALIGSVTVFFMLTAIFYLAKCLEKRRSTHIESMHRLIQ